MKKYLIKIALFFVLVAMVDLVYGIICDYLRDHTKGGFSGNVHYICEQCNEDIIMMGSSRMRHHYVPQIFEDSLNMSCYNTGIDGNGIILSYGFLEMILERYTPKMVIYDITGYDMYTDDNTKYLDGLRPYYYKANVAEIFNVVDPAERWKMKSSLYRYNSDLLGLLGDNIHPLSSSEKGYIPSSKIMDYEPTTPDTEKKPVVDSLKLHYLAGFITIAKEHNIPLLFVASPTYFGELLKDYNEPAKKICLAEGVPFVDCFYDESLCSSKNNWGDATHLNDKGARLFSEGLAAKINKEYAFLYQ